MADVAESDDYDEELVGRSLEELVRRALKGDFKTVGRELARRGPSVEAVDVLVKALRARSAQPWLIAHLLGRVGHEAGYDAVCDIIMDPDLTYADGYAGAALVRIDAKKASADLIRMLSEAPTCEGREDAAWGLSALQWRVGRSVMLDAALKGRVSRKFAAVMLVDLGVEPATVIEWFSSQEVGTVSLALEVVCHGARQPNDTRQGRPWSYRERRRLLAHARKVIADGVVEPKPYQRRDLRYGEQQSSVLRQLRKMVERLVGV